MHGEQGSGGDHPVHTALQLPREPVRFKDRAGAHRGEHGGGEATDARVHGDFAHDSVLPQGWISRRDRPGGDWKRRGNRRLPHDASRSQRDFVHGRRDWDPRRPKGGHGGFANGTRR